MKQISKEEYMNIMFDNSRNLTAKKSFKGSQTFVEAIFEGIKVVAKRIVTKDGVVYYAM